MIDPTGTWTLTASIYGVRTFTLRLTAQKLSATTAKLSGTILYNGPNGKPSQIQGMQEVDILSWETTDNNDPYHSKYKATLVDANHMINGKISADSGDYPFTAVRTA
jgi:hypothetical protein